MTPSLEMPTDEQITDLLHGIHTAPDFAEYCRDDSTGPPIHILMPNPDPDATGCECGYPDCEVPPDGLQWFPADAEGILKMASPQPANATESLIVLAKVYSALAAVPMPEDRRSFLARWRGIILCMRHRSRGREDSYLLALIYGQASTPEFWTSKRTAGDPPDVATVCKTGRDMTGETPALIRALDTVGLAVWNLRNGNTP